MNYQLKTFDDETTFWESLVNDFQALKPKTLGASGGSAANFFDVLPENVLANTSVYIVDERFVTEEHEHSNARLLRSKLGLKSGSTLEKNTQANNFYTWQVEQFTNRQECVQHYAKQLPEQMDLTLLGVGPDGHTASLFPNGDWLDLEQTGQKRCIATTTTEFDVEKRMSMTYSEIEKSKNIWILMIGKNKQSILDEISQQITDFHQYPARKILDYGATIYFLNS